MKFMNWWLRIGIFVAGFFLAWVMKRHVMPTAAEQGAPTPQSRSLSATTTRANSNGSHEREKELLRQWRESPSSKGRKSMEIAKSDYPKIIKEFISQSGRGLKGMNDVQQLELQGLVCSWHEADPEAALRWALGHETSQNPYLSAIIGSLSVKDMHAAIALAERYGAAQGRHIDMPDEIFGQIGKLDAKEFLRVSGMFTRSSGKRGGLVDFADGFDFRQALDGMVEREAGGNAFSNVPSNLLSEWAKRDKDAAWEWALSGKGIYSNDIHSLLVSTMADASTEEVAGLAARILKNPDRSQDGKFSDVVEILVRRTNPEMIASFLDQAPGERQDNLNELVAKSIVRTEFNEILMAQMTPAERITAFQSDAVRRNMLYFDEGRIKSTLRWLGHSAEEIQRMLPGQPQE